jgi:hypothetical protein
MNIHSLIILSLLATFSGLIGLGLVFLPMKTLLPKMTAWYKKITRTPLLWIPLPRSEPSFRGTGLKNLKLIKDTPPLLFEKNTFDPRAFSILYLMARPGEYYTGYVLWQALMSQKLSYSTMKIFHAHETDNATGRVLFSVANALEPGYFDSNHIDKIKISGLCLFMHHHSLSQPLKTFENMLKVAKRLEHLLGGTLCDSQHQPLSESIIQDYYAKLSSLVNEKYHG